MKKLVLIATAALAALLPVTALASTPVDNNSSQGAWESYQWIDSGTIYHFTGTYDVKSKTADISYEEFKFKYTITGAKIQYLSLQNSCTDSSTKKTYTDYIDGVKPYGGATSATLHSWFPQSAAGSGTACHQNNNITISLNDPGASKASLIWQDASSIAGAADLSTSTGWVEGVYSGYKATSVYPDDQGSAPFNNLIDKEYYRQGDGASCHDSISVSQSTINNNAVTTTTGNVVLRGLKDGNNDKEQWNNYQPGGPQNGPGNPKAWAYGEGEFAGYPWGKASMLDHKNIACYETNSLKVTVGRTWMGAGQDGPPVLGLSDQGYNLSGLSSLPSTNPNGSSSVDACSSDSQSFAWMICPAASLIQTALTTTFKDLIQPALTIEPIMGDPNLKAVWQSFVGVADVLFILAFMIIVFGMAIRVDIDAYTIKKALPKLIAAAILVQFSFFICAFIIDIGNILGVGILQLVGNTIHGVSTSGGGVGAKDMGYAIAGGMLTVAAGVGFAIIAGPTLLVLLVGLIISAVTFLVTLAVRKLLIIAFVILSPVAFVLWILPNTESWFERWYKNFLKAVMIYPIIAILLSVGYIIQAAANTKNGFGGLTAILAPTIAFFMMPMAFKWGGGIMGAAQGAISSRGKRLKGGAMKGTQGALDRSAFLKNRGAEKRAGWINQAQGTGFGARYAQRRLGMGWKSTPLAANQINTMAAKEEAERQQGATRQIRDIPLDTAGKATLAALAAGQDAGGIQATEAVQHAALTRLASTQQTAALSALPPEVRESSVYKRVMSENFEKLKDVAPHLVRGEDAFRTMTREGASKLNADGMRAYLEWAAANGQHQQAFNNIYEATNDSVLARNANAAGMLHAREQAASVFGAQAGAVIESRIRANGEIIPPARQATP